MPFPPHILFAQLPPDQEMLGIFLYIIFAIVFLGVIAYAYHSLLKPKPGKSSFGFDARVASLMDELSVSIIGEEDFKKIFENIQKLARSNKKHPDILALWLRYHQRRNNLKEVMRIANEIQHSNRFGNYYNSKNISELTIQLCEQLGDKRKAFQEILDLAMQHPKELSYLEKAADFAEELGEKKQQSKFLKQIISLDSEHPKALFKLSKLALQERHYRSALGYLQEAAKNGYSTSNTDYCYTLATTLHRIGGREQSALRNYETAVQSGNENLRKSILPRLGQLYFQTQNYSAAIGALCSYLSNYGLSMELLLLLASSYEKAFRIKQACNVWEYITKQNAADSKSRQSSKWAQEKLDLYRSVGKNMGLYFYLNADKEPFAKFCEEFVQQFDEQNKPHEEHMHHSNLPEGCYVQKIPGKQIFRTAAKVKKTPNSLGFMFFRHNVKIRKNIMEILFKKLCEASGELSINRCKIYLFAIDDVFQKIGNKGESQIFRYHGERFQKLSNSMKFSGVEEVKMLSPISVVSSDNLSEMIRADAHQQYQVGSIQYK